MIVLIGSLAPPKSAASQARRPPLHTHSPAESCIIKVIRTRRRSQPTKLRCRQLRYARANRRWRREAPFFVRGRLETDTQRAARSDLVRSNPRVILIFAIQFDRIDVDIRV